MDRPVFVLGERPAAIRLVEALGDTPTLYAMPPVRLLPDLLTAADRYLVGVEHLPGFDRRILQPADWYREIQAAHLRACGKSRTVEFSGLPILRLSALFPEAQFVVVRHLDRAMPRSQTPPAAALERILQVDSATVDRPSVLKRVLAFLLEVEVPAEVDISDSATFSAGPHPNRQPAAPEGTAQPR